MTKSKSTHTLLNIWPLIVKKIYLRLNLLTYTASRTSVCSDINTSTYFDKTIYILELPHINRETLNNALMLLS